MFNKIKPKSAIDEAIELAHRELAGHEIHSDEYAKAADQLVKLYEIKKNQTPDRVSKDTLAIVAANLLGILVIIKHEDVNVVTSKALSFVQKLR